MRFYKIFKSIFVFFICAPLFLYACHASTTPGNEGNAPAVTSQEGREKSMSEKPESLKPESPEDIVATVNGTKIFREELDRNFKAHLSQDPSMESKLPEEQKQQLKRIILDRLIETELIYQKGQELGIEAPDEEINSRLDQFKKQFPKEGEFEEKLKENNTTMEELQKDLRKNMIISKVVQQQMASQADPESISDEELKKYYDENKDQFKQEKMVKASHILVKVDNDADEATRAKAKEKITAILKRVKAGEDFAKLAMENSDCPSSKQGGDLGFFTSKQMVPEFSKAAFNLKLREVSDIVETPFGYHIIKVTDIKPAGEASFEDSKGRIKQYLGGKQRSDLVKNYIKSLRDKADIKTFMPDEPPPLSKENPVAPAGE